MAEGGDELVDNLEENQNLKNTQGKMLYGMKMGLPELPVSPTSSPGSYITAHRYSMKSSTDLKGPLQAAPPLSPVPQDAQDPQVTSTTGRDFDYSEVSFVMKGSEEYRLTGQWYQPAQPDSTSHEGVCSESQPSLPSSSKLQAQSHFSSPRESLSNPSCSQRNDLNAVNSPQPTSGSGPNMPFPAFYPPTFLQLGSVHGVSWLPCTPLWFNPNMVQGTASINPYMPVWYSSQPTGGAGISGSPCFDPPYVSPAATSQFSNNRSDSSQSSHSGCDSKYKREINDETRITNLPLPMIRWISMKMDDTYAEKNWQDVADRHGWLYEKINDHKQQCCNFQRSFFEWMLKKDTFSIYTVGKFKEDMKAIGRRDVYEDFDEELNKHLLK